MANTSSAKKTHKSSLNKQVFNLRRKRALHGALKTVRALVTEKKKDEAQTELPKAYKALDKASKRGIIKKNTASRLKSRLSASIKKIG